MKAVDSEQSGLDAPATPSASPQPGSATGARSLWSHRGLEDVYFQREAQVTWWSIMGGVAASALLTQLAPLVAEVQAGRWYLILYYAASALFIVIGWLTTAWASLIMHWPIVPFHVLLVFAGGFTTAATCLLVTRPAYWFVGAAPLVCNSMLTNGYDIKTDAYGGGGFPAEALKRTRTTLWIYGLFLILAILAVVTLLRWPSPGLELIWGIAGLLAATAALVWQHINMRSEREMGRIP